MGMTKEGMYSVIGYDKDNVLIYYTNLFFAPPLLAHKRPHICR